MPISKAQNCGGRLEGRRTGGITPYAAILAQTFSELDLNNGGFALACALEG
jgi:hypothetical protein